MKPQNRKIRNFRKIRILQGADFVLSIVEGQLPHPVFVRARL